MTDNPVSLLREDLQAIYIGNLNTVDANLDLPTEGKNGSEFVWKSSEDRFITEEGIVHRPLYGMGNRTVMLTVTGTLRGEKADRVFCGTVLQQSRETVITRIDPVRAVAAVGSAPALPSFVIADCADGRRITTPVVWNEPGISDREQTVTVIGRAEGTEIPAQAVTTWVTELSAVRGPEIAAGYYPLRRIRLLPGTPYYKAQQRMTEYLLAQDVDHLLYNFRRAAGLSVRGASPMTGWDAETCKLKGHTTGHTLSGLALAYAATGNRAFREKLTALIEGLAECQIAFAASGKTAPGFLSAYSEEQFDLLEVFTKYPEIWAPYYTLDKIMSGLYDAYTLAGCQQALDILSPLGDWVYRRLSRLSKETRDRMWSMYIAGEFGGMLGTMVRLYGLTGKKEHLAAAKFFLNEKLFYPMEQNRDTLEDMHANQHIPQILGAMDLYAATGEEKYWRLAKNFWEIVTGHHTYCVGGVGETEMFHRAESVCDFLTDKAAESCASYNLLRLTAELFRYTEDGSMMDYYERTLRNHILTSASRKPDGGTTYFLPLRPGGRKAYSTTENTCCRGTGLESRYRYQENIFAYSEKSILVNLWVDSVLHAEDGTDFLTIRTGEGRITVTCVAACRKALWIRVPSWAKTCTLARGQDAPVRYRTDSLCQGYLLAAEKITAGLTVTLTVPLSVREVPAPDRRFTSFAYGNDILAAVSDEETFLAAPETKEFHANGEKTFAARGLRMIPICRVDQEAYHVYFKK